MTLRALIISIALCAMPTAGIAQIREETFEARSDEAVLAGTLVLPADRPRAAVVLIQGNGPHGRDQIISGTPMFRVLADELAQRGIASVRIDNSGVGASTGARIRHFRERTPQIVSVFDALASYPDLQGVPLGLIGHSEGTMVATEVWIERGDTLDFLVLLGAPGRPGRTVWIDQQANPARFPDHDAAGHARIRAALERVVDLALADDRSGLEAAADHLFQVSGLSAEEAAEIRPGFVERMSSAEMRVFLRHDPADAFVQVTDPVLTVWGGIDPLTSPELNVPVFLEGRNPESRLTVVVLPDEDHFFLRGKGLVPGEHRFGEMSLSPRLVDVIADWLSSEQFRR